MIKNLGEVIKQLKPLLPKYLEENGIKPRGKLFKCPNSKEHNNEDAKPSCNFLDNNKEGFYCYACHAKGDIFDALKLIENKDIVGENFSEAVKYLCKKYNVAYQEITTEEEKFYKEIHNYLSSLTNTASLSLQKELETNEALKKLITTKQWAKCIDKFKLGYLSVPFAGKADSDMLAYLSLNPQDLVGRLIIPIINHKGQIIGITTRVLEVDKKNAHEAAYKHYVAYSLKHVCYNISNIDPDKEVIVVEGPSSVLTMYNYGITNVVATFGNLMGPSQYGQLVRRKVKKMLFLYDDDDGGKEGLRNSLKVFGKNDIDAKIGFLTDNMDPGDYVIKYLNLSNIKKIGLYDYLLDQYSKNTNDKYIEKCLMGYILSIDDLVKKENIINNTSKSLKITKSTIVDLLAIYENNENVSTSEILKERESLVETLNAYEKWAWSRGQILGLKSFKSFDIKFDGVQNGFILIGGRPNIGKSALLISLAHQIITKNNNIYMLYFTIDDSMYTTISRFLATISGLPINIVSNPNYKIQNANLPPQLKRDYINKREQALNFLRQSSSLFNLKDSDEGATIEAIQEKIKTILPLTHSKQLVVVIDNLHNLRSKKFYTSDRHLFSTISNQLNGISNTYGCPVIASTHITKDAIKNKVYDGTALKDTVDLDFDNKLFMMVDTEEDDLDGTKEDIAIKVVVAKNKFSAFKGKIDMMFYRSLSKVEDIGNYGTSPQKDKDESNLFT